jgi:hypothetical protein
MSRPSPDLCADCHDRVTPIASTGLERYAPMARTPAMGGVADTRCDDFWQSWAGLSSRPGRLRPEGALRDRNSLVAGLICAVIIVAAS